MFVLCVLFAFPLSFVFFLQSSKATPLKILENSQENGGRPTILLEMGNITEHVFLNLFSLMVPELEKNTVSFIESLNFIC